MRFLSKTWLVMIATALLQGVAMAAAFTASLDREALTLGEGHKAIQGIISAHAARPWRSGVSGAGPSRGIVSAMAFSTVFKSGQGIMRRGRPLAKRVFHRRIDCLQKFRLANQAELERSSIRNAWRLLGKPMSLLECSVVRDTLHLKREEKWPPQRWFTCE